MRYYILLIFVLFITSCLNKSEAEKNILTVGNGNDVEVTLKIENKKEIEKIEFYSSGNIESINRKNMESYKKFIYSFENKGEGTFKICIYKANDTICTESYVEKGYSPEIEFVKDSLVFTKFI
jgi:hypothetical protein